MPVDALARRLTDTFIELARIDSVSFEEGEIADAVQGRLEAVGLTTWRDESAAITGSETGNLLGRLEGLAGAGSLLFMAHLDTVEPGRGVRPVVDETRSIIRSFGDTILGGDDKAAVAVVLEALRTLQEEDRPHGDIYVIFSVAEEQGLKGAKALELSRVEADHCFVLDAEGEVGQATVAAPSQMSIRARVHGKAAHAGVNPSDGINAIAAAARAIATMRLGQVDEETTANIGRIAGGRATNIVPDLVELAGETRSHDPAKLERVTAEITAALDAAKAEGCRVEVEVAPEYRGFSIPEGAPIRRLFERACARVGAPCGYQVSNGGSDANVLNDAGIPALVLACGTQRPHSTEESVGIDQLVLAHDLVLALIAEAMGAWHEGRRSGGCD